MLGRLPAEIRPKTSTADVKLRPALILRPLAPMIVVAVSQRIQMPRGNLARGCEAHPGRVMHAVKVPMLLGLWMIAPFATDRSNVIA